MEGIGYSEGKISHHLGRIVLEKVRGESHNNCIESNTGSEIINKKESFISDSITALNFDFRRLFIILVNGFDIFGKLSTALVLLK
jgi:hypothetical protein